MSVDPDPASVPDPTPSKNPAEPAGESPEVTRLKRRFKKGVEAEGEENPDQTIQLLSSLLQDLVAKKEQAAAPEAEMPRTAKYHRLSKTGGSSGVAEPSSQSAAPEAGGMAAPPPASFRPTPVYRPSGSRSRRGLWIALCLLGLLGFSAATVLTILYFRPAAGKSGLSGKLPFAPAGVWTNSALRQLDQALAADQAGDTQAALRIASALQSPGAPPLPGLEIYLAGLRTRLDLNSEAEAGLMRAVSNAPPAESALTNERLAFNSSRVRDFEKAVEHYQNASRTNPFSASMFYHWGEATRHLGHLADAVAIFRRALERVPTGQPEAESLRDCIGLKIRLCQVEAGQEEKFQGELAERLTAPMPSGYWLLTAAAGALQNKDLPEAAGFLSRARDALGPGQFEALLNDYFFRAYAGRKELADFFPPDPAARRAKLLPTMTYSIEP